ncbi:MAG: DUF3574 domain-containing protein [Verrucomicrobiota bacterium]
MRSVLILISLWGLMGCQTTSLPQEGEASAYAADRAGGEKFVRTELYFAIGLLRDDGTIDSDSWGESRWNEFVEEIVVPLFPDGLTVFDATGRWLSDRFEKPPRLGTKVLVILHPETEESEERIEKIRGDFLEITGQQSVLRVSQAAEVSF